ncbi:MAG TPA: AAA family ATPase, partial [Pirellulales bacterium]|nr:AAA family ATPase [Pirellulales bacterium]
MNFNDLKVDGFGVWSGLELPGLSAGLNVFYGPNEAGKTTLLQFARAMLYGFSPERRAHYLPPVRGGRGGGSLGNAGPSGRFRISRLDRENLPLGEVTVAAADGTIQGEPQLRELLADVDEGVFNNVFAVGLGELQELGTLDGTAVARLLYDLSTGLDRVSLGEVMRELESSCSRLLSPDDRPSQIVDLLAKRDKLRGELDELSTLTARHWRLAGDRDRLAQEIARAEAEVAEAERETRVVELASSLEPKWQARAALDEQIAAVGPPSSLPPNALARMDRLKERLHGCRRALKRFSRRRKEQRDQLASLKINAPLWKQAPRILALAENESWIAAAEQQLRDAEEV